jgi:hypothetical protein
MVRQEKRSLKTFLLAISYCYVARRQLVSNSIKEQIKSDLEKAKTTGQLRSENIRQIVSQAIFQAVGELKEGSGEIGSLVKDTIHALTDTFKEKSQDVKEEIQASIEGVVDGISRARQEAILKDRDRVQELQTQIDREEAKLQSSVDSALTEIEVASQETNPETRSSIQKALEAMKDSEEVALMRKRYAQLQTELAILQANLASRYGERYEEVKQHLDRAQTWYTNAQEKSESTGKTLVEQKQTEFEAKLSQAGAALARKEKEVKHILQDLWRSFSKDRKP